MRLSTALLLLAGTCAAQEPPRTNRLAGEASPYLRQHATNPVDWYPWGDEAFEKARKEDKVVFLSIGYSTCHWCHVMERESFESEAIAAILNERFVSIKVDREERPDVDAIYMAFVQALHDGRGGWPLTVFLTPEARPIWGETYLAPARLEARLGEIHRVWTETRREILEGVDGQTEQLRGLLERTAKGDAEPGAEALSEFTRRMAATHDAANGGFGRAPKFPLPLELLALLAAWKRTGDAAALAMVETTLDRMAAGGIYDHLGGGFHRYSTDDRWLVPHFEKMLHDQALLAQAYLEAFRATGHERHLAVARDVLDYVLADLTDPSGGFHSAEDADSEGAEGKFYVWTAEEVAEVLDGDEERVALATWGVRAGGNFVEAFRHEGGIPAGTNVLHVASAPAGADRAHLEAARTKLLDVRRRRVRPSRDDKVLAGWNGLAISAFAIAHEATGDERYRRAAEGAAHMVLETMVREGRLLRRYRAGEAGVPAFLEDHAFLGLGLVDLYEATFEPRWLVEAVRLTDEMVRLFHDEAAGGFFLAGSDAEALVARTKEVRDGAIPSGNSVAVRLIGRLARMTGEPSYEALLRETLETFSGLVARSPDACPELLRAVDFAVGPTREVVLAGPLDESLLAMKRAVQRRYDPRLVLLHHPPGEDGAAIRRLVPFLAGQGPLGGRATAYVCRRFACEAPTTDLAELLRHLEE